MTPGLAELADAVLYEGLALYPYRPSALKNRLSSLFGTLMPPAYIEHCDPSERSSLAAQVLWQPDTQPALLQVNLRFLQSAAQPPGAGGDEPITREVCLELAAAPGSTAARDFSFPAPAAHIRGWLSVAIDAVRNGLLRFSVSVENRTPLARDAAAACDRASVMPFAMGSAHCLLETNGGAFVSLLDPPEPWREAALECRNRGVFPVLAGAAKPARAMLCSPIILYDYPRLAPQSPGNLYDSLEIDEILSLRIQTLTGDEKRELSQSAPHLRSLLERTEALTPDQLRSLHGTLSATAASDCTGLPVYAGDVVRLNPRAGADIFDLALAGRLATVESIEQDLEGNFHVAVTVNDDPGRDFGAMRQIGHRFFFRPAEIERVSQGAIQKAEP